MANVWSVSQQKFINTSETPQGGVSSEVPSGMTQGSGLNLREMFSKLFQQSPDTALKQGSKFKTAIDIISPTQSATQEAEVETKQKAGTLVGAIDTLYKDWEKIPLEEKIPFPFRKKTAENLANYEVKKKLYTYQVITMLADKRVSDAERDYFITLFPKTLDSKKVAKTKLDAMKDFIKTYSNIESPATRSGVNREETSIDSLWQ